MSENPDARIKVVILMNEVLRGGAQRIVLDIARNIDKKLFSLQIVYLKPETIFATSSPSFKSEFEATGVPLFCISGGPHFSFTEALRLYQFLRREKPRVLQTFLPYASVLGRIIGRLARVPHITSVQCNLPIAYDKKIYWLDRLTLFLADAWTGTTEGIEQSYGGSISLLTREAWSRGRRHFTIVGGVDLPAFDARLAKVDREKTRRDLGISAGDTLIMMSARLVSWKGNADVIDAMKFLPSTVHVALVGYGPLETELRTQVEKEGLVDRVHFLISLINIAELFASSDIYVQAHRYNEKGNIWKGPNMSQEEACAAHLPSVSTKVPLIETLIEDGVTGLLARPNDPRDLARALTFLYEHPDEAQRMANAARTRVEERFSLEIMVRTYEQLFDLVANDR